MPYAYGGTMMTTIMPTLVTRMDMAILTATDALTTVIAGTIRPIAGLITAVIAVTIRGAFTPIIGPTFEPPPIAGSGSFRLEDNSKRPLFQRSLFFCCWASNGVVRLPTTISYRRDPKTGGHNAPKTSVFPS